MKKAGILGLLLCLSACSSDGGPETFPPESGVPDGGADAIAPPDAHPVSPPPPVEAGPSEVDATIISLPAYPRLLSQTGLYSDIATETLAADVRAFGPRYPAWSDGATTRRFLHLPGRIDSSDMDFWTYPVGTTAWEELTRNGVRVETRMLRKKGSAPGDWTMISYQWKSDGSDAIAIPEGTKNANGTPHDIPSQKDCLACHGNMKDVLLGVTAIQLSHSDEIPGLTIDDLIEEKRLTVPPSRPIRIPGDAVAEGALGYLHGNCGHCHNAESKADPATPLRLWEITQQLDTVETTVGYETTVGADNSFLPELHVIEPGRPDDSVVLIRISERGPHQMPPLATEVVDEDGVAKIRAWVEALGRTSDAGVPEGGIPEGGTPESGVPEGSVHEAGSKDASRGDGAPPAPI